MTMAYNSRTRDPLLEAQMQATIRKRGTEFLGLVFIVLAVFTAISLLTHSPNDPNFLNSTSGEIQNKMGVLGASFAGTFMLAIGLASWMETWPYSFSLGGFSGDAILEILIDMAPLSLEIWVRVLSLVLGLLTLWLGLFSLGFTWQEVKAIVRRVIRKVTSFGAKSAKAGAQTAKTKYEDRQKRKDGMPDIRTDEFMPNAAKSPKEMGRSTLFPTLPVFNSSTKEQSGSSVANEIREGPSGPVHDPREFMYDDGEVVQQTDRVTRRIKDAIIRKQMEEEQAAPMAVLDESDDAVLESTSDLPTAPTPVDNIFEGGVPVSENIFRDDAIPEPPSLPLDSGRQEPPMTKPEAQKSVVEYPSTKPIPQSKRAKTEAQPTLFAEGGAADYEQPALNLLESPTTIVRQQLSDEALEENARMLENVLDDYGVKGEIVSVRPGPVVTMYELEPAPGLKASRVIGLADDIARSMSALAARVSTVPGRTVIGIELPNDHRETVLLREILSARDYGDGKHGLPLALGKDIGGIPEVADLAKMPHLLIAGTTGSGKSVAINTMILSLLYKLSPDECRMIMIDPKMLELSVYDGIPHLLSPVVTDPRKAVVWVCVTSLAITAVLPMHCHVAKILSGLCKLGLMTIQANLCLKPKHSRLKKCPILWSSSTRWQI